MAMLRRLNAAASLGLSILAMSAPPTEAWVAGPPGARVLAWVCHPDYVRLCAGVPVGTGEALRCLAEQHHALSRPCGQALKVVAAIDACANDFRVYCPGVVPGEGRGAACLQGNIDRLSPECVRALSAVLPGQFDQAYVEHDRSPDLPENYSLPDEFKADPPDLDDAPIK